MFSWSALRFQHQNKDRRILFLTNEPFGHFIKDVRKMSTDLILIIHIALFYFKRGSQHSPKQWLRTAFLKKKTLLLAKKDIEEENE